MGLGEGEVALGVAPFAIAQSAIVRLMVLHVRRGGEGHFRNFLYHCLQLFDLLVFGDDCLLETLHLPEDVRLYLAERAPATHAPFPSLHVVAAGLEGGVAEGVFTLEEGPRGFLIHLTVILYKIIRIKQGGR